MKTLPPCLSPGPRSRLSKCIKDYYGISLSFFDTESPKLKIQQKIIESKSQSYVISKHSTRQMMANEPKQTKVNLVWKRSAFKLFPSGISVPTVISAIMEQTRLVSLRHAGELAGVQT